MYLASLRSLPEFSASIQRRWREPLQAEQTDKLQQLVRLLAADATSHGDEQQRLQSVVTHAVVFLGQWHQAWCRAMPTVASKLCLPQPFTPPFPEELLQAVPG